MIPDKRSQLFISLAGVSCVAVMSAACAGTPATEGLVEIAPGKTAPTPADPFPIAAAGWGPELGNGLMSSRWAEDWRGMRDAGLAPSLKAIPLDGSAALTISGESRLRFDTYHNAQLQQGRKYEQGLLRGVIGADLQVNRHIRFYGEAGTAQVHGQRDSANANFQNALSVQQAMLDARCVSGGMLVGAMLGRQEFGDGPRQLISLSDGPNLHRSLNGVRLYVHGTKLRLGAFAFRATRLGRGGLDEELNGGERLSGVNASVALRSVAGNTRFAEPFWYRTENANSRSGGRMGLDERDTLGLRLWGRQGDLRFDWTAAHQSGKSLGRDIDAWGVFTVQSYGLSRSGWKPRLTARFDAASGGGSYGTGKVRAFNQLYASSSYLGEGQFLSLSNMVMAAPGVSFTPNARSSVSVEYGLARRLKEGDAAYAGGMRPYAGTQSLRGREVGSIVRVLASWSVAPRWTLFMNYEDMHAGDLLRRAGLSSGRYVYVGTTYRY